jgi:outer membrane protein assembly factor BamB
VTGFTAPKTWPKELTQKWKVKVGSAVATPALVGDKLYVFAREGGDEILRCLDAATGKELWQDKYEAQPVTGIAAGGRGGGDFAGPRSSPAVADGKIVTLGGRGTLSCVDAATGKKLWRKDDFKGSVPKFFVSSSPIVVDGLCIAQLGGERDGGIVAYDLATGNEKWKWTGNGPANASPALLTVDGAKVIVAETAAKVVGIGAADGKLLWETPFSTQQMQYNAASPMVDGQTVIYSGTARGMKAVKFDKQGDGLAAKEVWSNARNSLQFSTPVLKDGMVYGISQSNEFFCLNAQDGKIAWTAPAGQGGGGGGGGGGMRGGRGGYGCIVDAGPVLLALTPTGQLTVLEPSAKEFKQLAKYKVSDSATYAYPIVAGNRVYVKDSDSLILWTIE